MMGTPAPRRWIVDDHGDIRHYRQCTTCHAWLEQTLEHYRPRQRHGDHVLRYHASCRTCAAAYQRARYHRDDGWRENRLVAERMNRRIRRLAAGLPVRDQSNGVDSYEPKRRRTGGFLDSRPFAEALEEWRAQQTAANGRYVPPRGLEGREPDPYAGYDQLAELAGISARAIYRYRTGESPRIALHIADRLAIELGRSLPEMTGE